MHQNSAEASENMQADYTVGNDFTIHALRPFITFDETGHDKTAGLAVLSCFFLVVPFVGG